MLHRRFGQNIGDRAEGQFKRHAPDFYPVLNWQFRYYRNCNGVSEKILGNLFENNLDFKYKRISILEIIKV